MTKSSRLSFLKRFFFVFFIGLTASSPAMAHRPCYTIPEMKSEQWLRLHSELMVITVSCRQNSSGDSLAPIYREFTLNNISALHDAEETLMAFYKNNYRASSIRLLDKLRTRLANEFGHKAAILSAPQFCEIYGDKVDTMNQQTLEQLDQEVTRMIKSEKSEYLLCSNATQPLAKPRQ